MDSLTSLQETIVAKKCPFALRLMKVLDFVADNSSPEITDVLGVRWVTDDIFEVTANTLATFLNIKPNSLNRNMRCCGILCVPTTAPHRRGKRLMRHNDGIIRKGACHSLVKTVKFKREVTQSEDPPCEQRTSESQETRACGLEWDLDPISDQMWWDLGSSECSGMMFSGISEK